MNKPPPEKKKKKATPKGSGTDDGTKGTVKNTKGADKVTKSAVKNTRGADKVPKGAVKNTRGADKVPKSADKNTRSADKVPKGADKSTRSADKVPKGTGDPKKKSGSTAKSEADSSELYEKMSQMLRDQLQKAGTVTEEVFEKALKETREWGEKMKGHYHEDISKISEYLKRDWLAAIKFTRSRAERGKKLDRWQVGILDVLSTLARSAGEQLESFASKINDRLSYRSGEVAGAGTLVCGKCEETIKFAKATRIPPCSKCGNTEFRRTF